MRLLLLNPNISSEISELIRDEAQRAASQGTEIEVLTAPFGVAYIETRFEALFVPLPGKMGEHEIALTGCLAPLRRALIDDNRSHVRIVVSESDYRALERGIDHLPPAQQ